MKKGLPDESCLPPDSPAGLGRADAGPSGPDRLWHAQTAATPRLAVAETRTITVSATAAGVIEPVTMVEVKSKASGEIVEVLVEEGDEVRRGQLLVRVDPRIPENAVVQARADSVVGGPGWTMRRRSSTGRRRCTRPLVEAMVLCILGGIIGIVLGMGIAKLVAYLNTWTVTVGPAALALAVGFSVAVGLFFGVWLARRAARLDPIEALRYE